MLNKQTEKSDIIFNIHPAYTEDLKNLPWNIPLEKWDSNEVRFLDFRKGLSRHPVRFVKTRLTSYAIKQTTEKMAVHELENYEKLLKQAVHTLIPIGYIKCELPPIRIETKVGQAYLEDEMSFVITILEHKALPDSYLYQLNFKEENKKIIWNAVAELLAVLHFNNVYWGDASLANILIRFFKVRDQKGRVRTQLKAILADAETLELLSKIPIQMRKEDLDFFFESMTWLNQDYKKAGYTRGNFSTAKDKKYILETYQYHYKLLKTINRFEKSTGINVRRHFKIVHDVNAIAAIRKQIDEHKWYLSERNGKEISVKKAAENWLKEIYMPILNEFEKLNIFEYFPFKTTNELYVDIMTHKYYMSQLAGKDVGIEKAITDYSKRYSEGKNFTEIIKKTYKNFIKLFY